MKESIEQAIAIELVGYFSRAMQAVKDEKDKSFVEHVAGKMKERLEYEYSFCLLCGNSINVNLWYKDGNKDNCLIENLTSVCKLCIDDFSDMIKVYEEVNEMAGYYPDVKRCRDERGRFAPCGSGSAIVGKAGTVSNPFITASVKTVAGQTKPITVLGALAIKNETYVFIKEALNDYKVEGRGGVKEKIRRVCQRAINEIMGRTYGQCPCCVARARREGRQESDVPKQLLYKHHVVSRLYNNENLVRLMCKEHHMKVHKVLREKGRDNRYTWIFGVEQSDEKVFDIIRRLKNGMSISEYRTVTSWE